MTTAAQDRRAPAFPLLELRAPAELVCNTFLQPRGLTAPKAEPRNIIVLPGFLASDVSTIPLRRMLRRWGHIPHGWELGRNVGPTKPIVNGLEALLDRVSQQAGRKVPIVGWSLGGLYGRFLAQRYPEKVEQVISLGSPINLTATEPTLTDAMVYEMDSQHHYEYQRGTIDLDKIGVPSTAVFTRTDGVVSWQSCVQSEDHQSENVEVHGSHIGLGANTAVSHLLADRLSQPPGTWSPFKPKFPINLLFPRDNAPAIRT